MAVDQQVAVTRLTTAGFQDFLLLPEGGLARLIWIVRIWP
jgi:hypothetical protein